LTDTTLGRKEKLHRRGLWLEWFTVAWNVVEAVAIGVGLAVGRVALIGFGVDSGIEVISAVALLWRLYRAGPNASAEEHGDAERKALYPVAATFFFLTAYILYEALGALLSGQGPQTSRVALGLSILSISSSCRPSPSSRAAGERDGQQGARGRLGGDRRGCAPTSRLRCWPPWDSTLPSAGGGPTLLGH
jgi:hypothetical protein